MVLIGYGRVSTLDQNPDAQRDLLTAAGCDRVFIDHGVSGKLARRPELDAALAYVRDGDVLAITKLDRLGRSVANLVEQAAWLEKHGVGLPVLQQGIDTTSPGGRLVFHIMAAIAEFERNLTVERTQDGLAAARARGRNGGRRRVLTLDKLATARKLYDSTELTVQQIADIVGCCSRATPYRELGTQAGESLSVADEAVTS